MFPANPEDVLNGVETLELQARGLAADMRSVRDARLAYLAARRFMAGWLAGHVEALVEWNRRPREDFVSAEAALLAHALWDAAEAAATGNDVAIDADLILLGAFTAISADLEGIRARAGLPEGVAA